MWNLIKLGWGQSFISYVHVYVSYVFQQNRSSNEKSYTGLPKGKAWRFPPIPDGLPVQGPVFAPQHWSPFFLALSWKMLRYSSEKFHPSQGPITHLEPFSPPYTQAFDLCQPDQLHSVTRKNMVLQRQTGWVQVLALPPDCVLPVLCYRMRRARARERVAQGSRKVSRDSSDACNPSTIQS